MKTKNTIILCLTLGLKFKISAAKFIAYRLPIDTNVFALTLNTFHLLHLTLIEDMMINTLQLQVVVLELIDSKFISCSC
jgi:hypothetical protein